MRQGIESDVLSVIFVAIIVAAPPLLFFWFIGSFNGSDVAFQSSDGQWADSEVQFKGRDFSAVAYRFEAHRIRCSAPEAMLQRITPRPSWYQWDNWFNNYSEPKWQVPYHEPYPHTASGHYRPADKAHCAYKALTPDESDLARQRATARVSGHAT